MQGHEPGRARRLVAAHPRPGVGDDPLGALDEHGQVLQQATHLPPLRLVLQRFGRFGHRGSSKVSELTGDRQHLGFGLIAAASQPHPDRVLMGPYLACAVSEADPHTGGAQAAHIPANVIAGPARSRRHLWVGVAVEQVARGAGQVVRRPQPSANEGTRALASASRGLAESWVGEAGARWGFAGSTCWSVPTTDQPIPARGEENGYKSCPLDAASGDLDGVLELGGDLLGERHDQVPVEGGGDPGEGVDAVAWRRRLPRAGRSPTGWCPSARRARAG